MCQICGKGGSLVMCLKCQAYDYHDAGVFEYNLRKETVALNVIKKILAGKRFTSMNLYKYVNTVHMRNEIMKFYVMEFCTTPFCNDPSYCLSLRRDPDAMLRVWRDIKD
jgi:hypothetical protein